MSLSLNAEIKKNMLFDIGNYIGLAIIYEKSCNYTLANDYVHKARDLTTALGFGKKIENTNVFITLCKDQLTASKLDFSFLGVN